MNATATRMRPTSIGRIADSRRLNRTDEGPCGRENAAISLAEIGRIIFENDRLLDVYDDVIVRIAETRQYLAQPGSRTRLGMAYLARLKSRKAHLQARLRANGIAVDAWLSQIESPPDIA